MSAVTERSRRRTAGKRMSDLVGKAMEDDETFWNHDTWQEGDDDDDAGSFHESDEDPEHRVDTFDSDFNDSESEQEDDEEGGNAAIDQEAELELQREEKRQKNNNNKRRRIDLARAGRELHQRKKGRIKGNRIFGDGVNAGLVLHLPSNFNSAGIPQTLPAGVKLHNNKNSPLLVAKMPLETPAKAPSLVDEDTKPIATSTNTPATAATPASATSLSTPAPITPAALSETDETNAATFISKQSDSEIPASSYITPKRQTPRRQQTPVSSVASTRQRRAASGITNSNTPKRSSRRSSSKQKPSTTTTATTTNSTPTTTSTTTARPSSSSSRTSSPTSSLNNTNNSKRQKFTQEELLLEAATVTEPENERWLLSRKRLFEQAQAHKAHASALAAAALARNGSNQLLHRFYSKRGSKTTITFFNMDAVPEMLTSKAQQQNKTNKRSSSPTCCIITGKAGIYRDPKTRMRYHNVAAFRELRRRHDMGEPLDQRQEQEKTLQTKEINDVASSATPPKRKAPNESATPVSITSGDKQQKDGGNASPVKKRRTKQKETVKVEQKPVIDKQQQAAPAHSPVTLGATVSDSHAVSAKQPTPVATSSSSLPCTPTIPKTTTVTKSSITSTTPKPRRKKRPAKTANVNTADATNQTPLPTPTSTAVKAQAKNKKKTQIESSTTPLPATKQQEGKKASPQQSNTIPPITPTAAMTNSNEKKNETTSAGKKKDLSNAVDKTKQVTTAKHDHGKKTSAVAPSQTTQAVTAPKKMLSSSKQANIKQQPQRQDHVSSQKPKQAQQEQPPPPSKVQEETLQVLTSSAASPNKPQALEPKQQSADAVRETITTTKQANVVPESEPQPASSPISKVASMQLFPNPAAFATAAALAQQALERHQAATALAAAAAKNSPAQVVNKALAAYVKQLQDKSHQHKSR